VRNPDHFGEEAIRLRSNIAGGDRSKTQIIFEEEETNSFHRKNVNNNSNDLNFVNKDVTWEGRLPVRSLPIPHEGLFQSGFVPIECKAGDLVAFPGTTDHLSLPNYSKFQRHTFQLHLIEGESEGFTWADSNWLQYPNNLQFMKLRPQLF